MIVPVLWISRHDDILARGYADQGLLEAVLAREVWTPQDPITFEHIEVREDFPDVDGAFVVLPARHHTSREDVDWFKAQLDRLRWSVVLLSGDEEWAFPFDEIEETDTRKVWTMQPIPPHAKFSGMIPGGWYPGTHDALKLEHERALSRPLDWMFAGQITHVRRQQCAQVLRRLGNGFLHETEGYLQGMPQAEYFSLLAGAKVVPCPSGPCSVDTARTFEALEAGAVPVVDLCTPEGCEFDYWDLLFGEAPFPKVTKWGEFRQVLREELAKWPANANTCFAFWQSWKRRMTRQLDSDIREVAGCPVEPKEPDDLITVLVSTSPTPFHPDTEHIEQTIASVREQLPLAEILIAVDGVRDEQLDRKPLYDEYINRLLWLANNRWHNVLPVLMDGWKHQAGSIKAVMGEVSTPLILFVEHDTPLLGEIEWEPLCGAVLGGEANAIRFHHETTVLDVHEHLMLDPEPLQVETSKGTVPLRRTASWWQRPHLASTDFYRDKVLSVFSEHARTMIEDVIYGVVWVAYADHKEAGWSDWRVFIYSPEGNMKRSTHLDSRGDDEKFPMTWSYPGDIPAGAPR